MLAKTKKTLSCFEATFGLKALWIEGMFASLEPLVLIIDTKFVITFISYDRFNSHTKVMIDTRLYLSACVSDNACFFRTNMFC